MPITFTRALEVQTGERITSRQMNALARAVNDRLRSGIADGAWRVLFYFLNLWRQPRTNDGFLWPAQAEFLEFFMHLDPADFVESWPAAGSDEPGGANTGNPMMAFVFGSPGAEIPPEEERLLVEMRPFPATPAEQWALGKTQRGLLDPATGQQNAPALAAAQSYHQIRHGRFSPHAKSYGGYAPTPARLGDCGDGDAGTPPTPNYEIKFTPLRAGLPPKVYPGSCPPGTPGHQANHAFYVVETPAAYFVYTAAGVEILRTEDYLAGPYTGGGVLGKADGKHLARVLQWYASAYRGADSQRGEAAWRIENIAFDFETFFQRQYALAPARGRMDGAELVEDYPRFELTGAGVKTAGSALNRTAGGAAHATATGFVIAGFLLEADGAAGDVVLEIREHGTVLWTATLPAGESSRLIMPPAARAWQNLTVTLRDAVTLGGAGAALAIEFLELVDYRPQVHDAYLVVRMLSTSGSELTGRVDNPGHLFTRAKEIGDDFLSTGCLLNAGANGLPIQEVFGVNDNPVFEAARRRTRECVRIVAGGSGVRREGEPGGREYQTVSYGVSGGKSVLTLKRMLTRAGATVDLFAGIAPPREPVASGGIQAGVLYVARGGSVTYDGVLYAADAEFTGGAGAAAFTGAGVVFEAEGIRSSARPQGEANEWLMWPELKVYHPSESSLWKATSYSDYFALSNRCHFYSPWITGGNHTDLALHFGAARRASEPLTPPLAPEAPSGYNYAGATNTPAGEGEAARAFYKSCRIYEPPAEIESAKVVFIGGEECVRLVFKSRWHHSELAPAAISEDDSTWDAEVLRAEAAAGRTWENGVREYLLNQKRGLNCLAGAPGDQAQGTAQIQNPVQQLPDNPFGACYPHFFFTRLIPLVHEDGNETPDAADTRPLAEQAQRVETYLRAMCEGYVDGQTTVDEGCRSGFGNLYDYTWENVCFDAFGGRSIGLLPAARSRAEGFGPYPNTGMYAEVFRRLAQVVNRLDKARVMLPFELRCKTDLYRGELAVTQDWGDPCSAGAPIKMKYTGAPPAATELVAAGAWELCATISAGAAAAIAEDCAGGQWLLRHDVSRVTYRLDLINPDTRLALPPGLAELLDDSQFGFLAHHQRVRTRPVATVAGDSGGADGCCFAHQEPCPGFFWDGSSGYRWTLEDVENSTDCRLFTGGVIAPVAAAGDFGLGRQVGGPACAKASQTGESLEPIDGTIYPFVQVPLVDFAG